MTEFDSESSRKKLTVLSDAIYYIKDGVLTESQMEDLDNNNIRYFNIDTESKVDFSTRSTQRGSIQVEFGFPPSLRLLNDINDGIEDILKDRYGAKDAIEHVTVICRGKYG